MDTYAPSPPPPRAKVAARRCSAARYQRRGGGAQMGPEPESSVTAAPLASRGVSRHRAEGVNRPRAPARFSPARGFFRDRLCTLEFFGRLKLPQ